MSRRPSHYLSATQGVPSMSVPRAYYLQDEENDFSEGEVEGQYAWPEAPGAGSAPPVQMHDNMAAGPAADVTELYRRKPEEQRYVVSQEVVMADEPRYYYRPAALARLPQRRLPLAVTPSSHGPPGQSPAPLPGAYFPPPHEEPRMQYEGVVYRSSPHLHRMMDARSMSPSTARVMRRQQHVQEQNPQAGNMVRTARNPPIQKPVVSVPTPRFYRRNVYKRPSTLCIQLPSTPDPARPIKSRLPSTMPGLSIPPLSLRPAHASHYPLQQPMGAGLAQGRGHFPALERARANAMVGEQTEMEDRYRGRGVRRQLTARSAPPRGEDREKNEEDIDRVQRMMEQRGMHHEFGDESGSTTGDTDPKCSELELLLNQYEQIFSSSNDAPSGSPKPQAGSRRSSGRSRAKRKASSGRIAGLMKPRLPPSLKKRNSSKSSLKLQNSSSADEDRQEIEQMTAEVLDNLLQDLSVGGLVGDNQQMSRLSRTPSENRKGSSKPGSKPTSRVASNTHSRVGSRSESRAMSAREKVEKSGKDLEDKRSSKNLSSRKSQEFKFTDMKHRSSFDEIPTKTTFMQDKEKFSKFTNSSHTSFEQDKGHSDRHSRDATPTYTPEDGKDKLQTFKKDVEELTGGKESLKKPWTPGKRGMKPDDHAALELHRSKSYIVNLIDRALSRELGTIPEERSSKQYLNLDAKTAMDLISSKNMDTDMCLEITQAIADSLSSVQQKDQVNIALNPAPCSSTKAPDSARGEPNKPDGELMFSAGTEEPLYIKQLKKLRWGHLKHIQREMRRLEDLERFLDSCSSDK